MSSLMLSIKRIEASVRMGPIKHVFCFTAVLAAIGKVFSIYADTIGNHEKNRGAKKIIKTINNNINIDKN